MQLTFMIVIHIGVQLRVSEAIAKLYEKPISSILEVTLGNCAVR